MSEIKPMRVKVYPHREKVGMGNILWTGKFEMRAGKFPATHPVGGVSDWASGQYGQAENIDKFRAMGYWASCFPEGDGITWKPLNGQSDDQCMADIKEAFGWDAVWGVKP